LFETKENEASNFTKLYLKDGMDQQVLLDAVKDAGIIGLEHFLRSDSRRKIFLSEQVFIVMTDEAFEKESLLFQCRLYRNHDRYDKSFRFFVSSIDTANLVSLQERENACLLAVEIVGQLEPEKVVLVTALEQPFQCIQIHCVNS
jgi:hypothetical protein